MHTNTRKTVEIFENKIKNLISAVPLRICPGVEGVLPPTCASLVSLPVFPSSIVVATSRISPLRAQPVTMQQDDGMMEEPEVDDLL